MISPDHRPVDFAAALTFNGVTDWRRQRPATWRRGVVLNSLTSSALLTLLDYRERKFDCHWWVPLQRIAAKHQLSPKALNHSIAIRPLIDAGFLVHKGANAVPAGSYWLTNEGLRARQQMRLMIKAAGRG